MQFRTELSIPDHAHKLNLQTSVVTVGSCFAEVIGTRLIDAKVPALVNPFGTIFNPLSLTKLLRQAIDGQLPDEHLYLENRGVWFHYDFHSSWWASSKAELAAQTAKQMQEVRNQLQKAHTLILTFGTAYVYRQTDGDGLQIVANCHKMPNRLFEKELLSIHTISKDFQDFHTRLSAFNPSITFLLTVSPVRHTRDTLPLNAVSKSILRVACHELSQSLTNVHYFPAYELLMDDLRDYRFYKPDLIHPNEMAEEYIFQKFSEAYFDDSLKSFVREWRKIKQELAHRTLQPHTPEHHRFLTGLLGKLQNISSKANVTTEIQWIEAQLRTFHSQT